MGVLATTRAFGDRDLKQFGVIAEPEVTATPRSPDDEFLILATDGVSNVLSNEEVADVARRMVKKALGRGSPRAAAIRMAASAIGRFSRDRNSKDDITVVVVDLSQGSSPPSAQWYSAVSEGLLAKAATAQPQWQPQGQSQPPVQLQVQLQACSQVGGCDGGVPLPPVALPWPVVTRPLAFNAASSTLGGPDPVALKEAAAAAAAAASHYWPVPPMHSYIPALQPHVQQPAAQWQSCPPPQPQAPPRCPGVTAGGHVWAGDRPACGGAALPASQTGPPVGPRPLLRTKKDEPWRTAPPYPDRLQVPASWCPSPVGSWLPFSPASPAPTATAAAAPAGCFVIAGAAVLQPPSLNTVPGAYAASQPELLPADCQASVCSSPLVEAAPSQLSYSPHMEQQPPLPLQPQSTLPVLQPPQDASKYDDASEATSSPAAPPGDATWADRDPPAGENARDLAPGCYHEPVSECSVKRRLPASAPGIARTPPTDWAAAAAQSVRYSGCRGLSEGQWPDVVMGNSAGSVAASVCSGAGLVLPPLAGGLAATVLYRSSSVVGLMAATQSSVVPSV